MDTIVNRIAIVVLALLLLVVSFLIVVELKQANSRINGIEGFIVGQRETATGGVANVTLVEVAKEQQEAIKKAEETKE